MNVVQGIFIIFAFHFVGLFISYLIDGFIPGNIIGMVLLFLFLHFKLIHGERVKKGAYLFTNNMTIFFVPACAGVVGAYPLIKDIWLPLLIICVVSTLLVLTVVAILQQTMENRRK